MFSAASGRGLIEACARRHSRGIPSGFSAASGRGLLEAELYGLPVRVGRCFPRHRAAASLKPEPGDGDETIAGAVFRGIGPRPH